MLLLDEPTSALDVSIQKQVLDLLLRLQAKYGLEAYLFISHDLAVIRAIAHEVLVLRNGRMVEQGPTEALLASPQADYTRRLLAAALGHEREVLTAMTPGQQRAISRGLSTCCRRNAGKRDETAGWYCSVAVFCCHAGVPFCS